MVVRMHNITRSTTSTTPSTVTPTPTGPGRRPRPGRLGELTAILSDRTVDRSARLLTLQGWRGVDLVAACAAGPSAHRLAPAACAAGSLAVGMTGSFALLAMVWSTAVVGVFALNHPIELGYNRLARLVGMTPIPANRAGKRLGCVIGALMLGASGAAFLAGQPTVARGLAVAMGSVAAFVAMTNVCVPSMVFTLIWGSDRATAPSLAAAARGRIARTRASAAS